MKKRRKETKPRQRRHSPQEYLAAGLGEVRDPIVCRKLGVSRQCAYAMRKKLGIPYDVVAMRKRFTWGTDWSSVDWTRTNADLARALGLTELTVVHKRREHRRLGLRIPRAPR